jgi:two-component system chemotaxis response regulator CheY
MRSLFVEDEFTSRMQLKYFLEEYGNVDIAVNGTEAVEAYRMALSTDKPYNLICLDIKLPEKDGHQVLEEIRRIEARIGRYYENPVKIFMTTAVANIESVYDSRGLCNEYLLKPIEKATLIERLKKHNLIR